MTRFVKSKDWGRAKGSVSMQIKRARSAKKPRVTSRAKAQMAAAQRPMGKKP